MKTQNLNRTAFVTDRALEYFTEKNLAQQIGCQPPEWPIALLKELLDNALDAAESSGTRPDIVVTVDPDALIVEDNGPGLPPAVIQNSLDYSVRVSDKSSYVSPSRGQLGNALKCIWAAPFVVNGSRGCIEIQSAHEHHNIEVTLDRIAQKPTIHHTVESRPFVKNGTIVKMHYPQIASYLNGSGSSFYKCKTATQLLCEYSGFNPHASFTLCQMDERHHWKRTADEWTKWKPNSPTSPHWYDVNRLRTLIASYITHDNTTAHARTVRELISEFSGLSGSAKQKAVVQTAGFAGAYLSQLIDGGDVDHTQVQSLLSAMRSESRPVKPSALGVLGIAHLRTHMVTHNNVAPDSISYKKVEGEDGGMPFVLEVACGIFTGHAERSQISVGLNFTPTLQMPLRQLQVILGESRVDPFDPVCIVVHLACPRMDYVDTGKATLQLSPNQREALEKCLKAVTTQWTQEKRQTDRNDRVSERNLDRMRKRQQAQYLSIKEAAYKVMRTAYMKVSDNNQYPANARQIMYAARPLVLRLTGGKIWKNDSYFTQNLLPDFIEEHSQLTESWDVVFDARGKLVEPHTGTRVDLGTLAVRRHLNNWHNGGGDDLSVEVASEYPTSGPMNRYRYALFLEKEGFNELLEAGQLANRYDIAIMSTKGMSVTASRHLVQELSDAGVTVFVLHDFDKAGFSIIHTLRTSTRRFTFKEAPRVVDLGLRLDDIEAMQLDSESVEYPDEKDPRENLRDSGATETECNFLVRGRRYGGRGWQGERVELNAMTSPQFLSWIENKLQAHGVGKVVPDAATLESAYRRAWQRVELQKVIDRATKEIEQGARNVELPDDLQESLSRAIENTATPWDVALCDLIKSSTR